MAVVVVLAVVPVVVEGVMVRGVGMTRNVADMRLAVRDLVAHRVVATSGPHSPTLYARRVDRNGRRVLAAKAARAFGFGLDSVALGAYLAELRLAAEVVGLILGAALVGTTLLTVLIAARGDRIGRRRLLIAGSLLMALAALIPVAGPSPALLVLIALSGMVAVTSNESTGLHAVDQAIIAGAVSGPQRARAFARYGVVAFVATAAGSLALGPMLAIGAAFGLTGSDRYAVAFVVYAALGLVAAGIALGLDERAESGEPVESRLGLTRSRGVVARLSALFALDSFASGLVVQGFLAYWFATRFGLDPADLGWLFATAAVFGAGSQPVAARLSERYGLIRTMVVSHIPASLLLIGVALTPVGLPGLAIACYLARSMLASMDVPARQAYVMSVVDPGERTAAAGVTSLARSAAQSAGPVVAGSLLVPLGLAVPLVVCGVLKIGYDLLLWRGFHSEDTGPWEDPAEIRPVVRNDGA